MKQVIFSLVAISALLLFANSLPSINHFSINTKTNVMIPDHVMTKDTVKVSLEKTSFGDMPVLFINDTAQTTESIKDILGKAYGELMQYVQDHQLQPQKFMAWYYSMQPPWPMDIAVETNSLPAETSGRIQSRTVKSSEVIIAHTWGPYDQVGEAYLKIEQWLKDNNRKAKGKPFEVYINDPAMVKSPAEIQTDIYQPIE